MDKVLSARVSEIVVGRIGLLARRLRTSKKQIIENAIALYAEKIDQDQARDVFEETCGAWSRKTAPHETVENARRAFRDSMSRRRR